MAFIDSWDPILIHPAAPICTLIVPATMVSIKPNQGDNWHPVIFNEEVVLAQLNTSLRLKQEEEDRKRDIQHRQQQQAIAQPSRYVRDLGIQPRRERGHQMPLRTGVPQQMQLLRVGVHPQHFRLVRGHIIQHQ